MHFITGNKNKLAEIQALLPEVEQLDIDLIEIQDIDPHVIITAKLSEAQKQYPGELIVEDTSLYLDALDGLPGPLIKWFMKTIGNAGLSEIAEKLGNKSAVAKTIIGYSSESGEVNFFEGVVPGQIVSPRGETTFGWDPIFLPDGYDQTFAEMDNSLKNQISMRKEAVEKLKEYLKQ